MTNGGRHQNQQVLFSHGVRQLAQVDHTIHLKQGQRVCVKLMLIDMKESFIVQTELNPAM